MWNYRVVRKKQNTHEEQIVYSYGIHEAYYNQHGYVRSITQDAIEPYGETIEELRHVWIMMAEAFGTPILDYEQIPEPGYDSQCDVLKWSDASDTQENEEIVEDSHEVSDKEIQAYYAEQEQQRKQHEDDHYRHFIGTPTLKELIEHIYADYTEWHKRQDFSK